MTDCIEETPDLGPEDRALEAKLSGLGEATRAEPDRGFEDRLKRINEAYGVLSASLG